MKLRKIWITPPFAIARVGKSSTPCASFTWGENDLTPRGTGKTTIFPTETLIMNQEGEITSEIPREIVFKDSEGFRPVCPFFELNCEWEDNEGEITSGVITHDLLKKFGYDSKDIVWNIKVGNLKPFHYTQVVEDKIYAEIKINGDNTEKIEIIGDSINTPTKEKLFIEGKGLPMGYVQLSKPTEKHPEFRLRIYAPKGEIYAPTDLPIRMNISVGDSKQIYELPEKNLIVNPNSSWAQYKLENLPRTNPSGLLATFVYKQNNDEIEQCVGLIDDVGDGIITVSLSNHIAHARFTIAPPDYSPDRRPFVSLADGLKDRIQRDDVENFKYLDDPSTTEEIRDLFERILETMELMNLDFQNDRGIRENRAVARGMGLPPSEGGNKLWKKENSISNQFLPLTEIGRQRHKRFVALEVLEDKLRENPELLEKWVRKPMTGDKFYDTKMPPLMRGSDRYPMHITQRQYNLLKAWVAYLRKDINTGS